MNKHFFGILALSSLVVAACTTSKQEDALPNKRELIERVLDQSKAPEIIPAAFSIISLISSVPRPWKSISPSSMRRVMIS